jgi:DNA ligase (NAD+)
MSPAEIYARSKSLLETEPETSLDAVKELGQILRFHEKKYYIDNDPIISDTEYDLLFKKLQKLEGEHPEWILADSPTQRVSSDLTEKFESVEHIVPMLSLDNSYNDEDLLKFDEQIKKLTQSAPDARIQYSIEPKFDGGSVAVIYEDDVLVRAATRGDGFKGENFTTNAKQIQTLPLRAPFSQLGIKRAELRGEAVIEKGKFAEINLQRQEDGKPLFANPRNTAAGGLRTKDPRETKERGTEIFIFQIGYAADAEGAPVLSSFDGHYNSIEKLHDLGFKVDHEVRTLCDGIEEVMEQVKVWEVRRDSYPYEIDGMVVKVDDFELQEKCGSTSHHPRWAIAFKFKAKQATTTLERVEYQVGKVGSITPVAKVTPVGLAGVTVSSISLHNEDFITSRDLRIGDKIIIERAGDVIPYVVKSLPDLRTGDEKPIVFPKHCPSCNTALIREEDEAAWRCPNPSCPDQILQRMFHHVSKDAMDIDGLGPAQITRFNELGWVHDIDDLYHLDYDAISQLEGFGQKSADNLREAIEKAKKNPIKRLIHSLSIHHVGKKVSKILAAHIGHVLELADWTLEDFTNIHEVGPVVANNVINFFADPERVAVLRRMEAQGVNLSQTEEDRPKKVAEDAPLLGKTILFTGSLQTMTRKQAQAIAEDNGAKNISAVSSNLDILVVGEKAGSKLKKAEALGTVQVMTEEEFTNLVKG